MARSNPVNFTILCTLVGAGCGLFIDYLVIGKPLQQWPLATHTDRAMVACIPSVLAILVLVLMLALEICPRRAGATRTPIQPATIAPTATGTETGTHTRKRILTTRIAPPPQVNTQNIDLEAQIRTKNFSALAGDHDSTELPAYTATASETPQAPPPTYSPSGRP